MRCVRSGNEGATLANEYFILRVLLRRKYTDREDCIFVIFAWGFAGAMGTFWRYAFQLNILIPLVAGLSLAAVRLFVDAGLFAFRITGAYSTTQAIIELSFLTPRTSNIIVATRTRELEGIRSLRYRLIRNPLSNPSTRTRLNLNPTLIYPLDSGHSFPSAWEKLQHSSLGFLLISADRSTFDFK